MTGLMSVNAYALEEKDVIGTWYVNELSMGGDILFHPGVMGMEVTVDIKEDGKMETTSSVYSSRIRARIPRPRRNSACSDRHRNPLLLHPAL